MTDTAKAQTTTSSTHAPLRLHHLAFTTYDIAATRAYYEEVIGMPLRQTWVEYQVRENGVRDEYVHCFFGLEDGGAIAYFQHVGWEPVEYAQPQPPFHIAFKVTAETQGEILERLHAHGYVEDKITDHGYCVSLYVTDPNGLRLEFTVDHEKIDEIVAFQAGVARAELDRFLGGDYAVNNAWRPHEG